CNTGVIDVPSLKRRAPERALLIGEIAGEQLAAESRAPDLLRPNDWKVLREDPWTDYADAEDAARRVVLIRKFDVAEAERRLGLKPSALSKWCKRHGIETT